MNPSLDDAFDPPAYRSSWLLGVLLTLAAVAVGYAIHLRDGEYTPRAIHWIGNAIALTAGGVMLSRVDDPAWGRNALLGVLAAAVAFQFYQLFRSPPGGWNWWSDDLKDKRPENLRLFYAGITIAAVASIGLLLRWRTVRTACIGLILVTHLLLGVWMVRSSPDPKIDVFVFQQEASAALLRGENPYAITYTDIYADPNKKKQPVYGEGISQDGKLNFGFPYLPVSLFMAMAGYVTAGDHRYAQVVAMTLAGAFLAFCRPGRVAALAAVLLLFTPRAFFVLGRAWTEPFLVCLLAGTVFCACRGLRVLPLALGLFLATKQYLVFALPAVLILAWSLGDTRRAWGLIWKCALVAVAVTLPLMLWNVEAFFHSTVTVQQKAPFRNDALSYLVWFKQSFGRQPDVAAAFLAMGVGMLIALWRAPRTPAGFAATLALTYLPFIAFNKQAFANYYYFTIGCLASAVAAMNWPENEPVPAYVPAPGDEFKAAATAPAAG